ncbi:MAG: hypothetical protein F6K30_15465 [Cyanothece sp. SIO2G6]|nr:hypothetical protein [Cyanothece sp. SIO2G6]
MVDAIRQIRQDLKTLTQAIATLATELDEAYDQYLMALRTSIQKQVVLACYHLCTNSYPEQFLQLSFRQREAFQQAIQTHIHQAQQQLTNAYVLATMVPKQDETDQAKGKKRRRSLSGSDQPMARSRRRPQDEDDGPSIEFIAIGGDMDEDDMMAIANDPSLTAALSELADNLSMDRGDIAERIKRELLSKMSSAESEDSDEIDDDDEIDWTNQDSDDATTDATTDAATSEDAPSPATLDQPSTATLSSASLSANPIQSADDQANLPPEDQTDQAADSSSPSATEFSEMSDTPEQGTAAQYTQFASGTEVPMPAELLLRQDQLEQNVAKVLHDLSKQVNYQFHQAGMIPQKLPKAVLDAALQSEASAEPSSGPPHVLSLSVEAEGKSKKSKVMRIKALNLRSSALEFNDPYLSTCRSRLREFTGQLQQVGKTYEKKQRSRAIAEAEAAWRSSWYDRES